MLRALGKEVRRTVVGLAAALAATAGVAVVLTWMGDQLIAQIGGM